MCWRWRPGPFDGCHLWLDWGDGGARAAEEREKEDESSVNFGERLIRSYKLIWWTLINIWGA
jgi:hypothetical protein